MSHLTAETNLVYVPVIYDPYGKVSLTMAQYDDFDFALEEARNEVARLVDATNEYYTAKIEIQIIPLYR